LQDKDNTLGLDLDSGFTSNFILKGRDKLNLIFFFKFKSKLQKLIELVLFLKEIKFQDQEDTILLYWILINSSLHMLK